MPDQGYKGNNIAIRCTYTSCLLVKYKRRIGIYSARSSNCVIQLRYRGHKIAISECVSLTLLPT